MLFLKVTLVLFGLAALTWFLGRFIHAYLYTELPEDLYWRGPAAGAGVWLVALAWPLAFEALFDANWPVNFNQLFLFVNERTDVEFEKFIVLPDKREYVRTTDYQTGAKVYRDSETRTESIPSTAQELIGVAGEQRVHFKVERDDKGTRWVEVAEPNRVMAAEPEADFGQLVTRSKGRFFLNFLAGLLTWGAWFAAFRVLLSFETGLALGLSIPFFLVWGFLMNLLFV